MATRRAKLLSVFQQAAEKGETVEDLTARIQEFTATGGSGIENFLDQTLDQYKAEAQPTNSVVETVKAQLYAAISTLDNV